VRSGAIIIIIIIIMEAATRVRDSRLWRAFGDGGLRALPGRSTELPHAVHRAAGRVAAGPVVQGMPGQHAG